MSSFPFVRQTSDGVTVDIYVQPGARSTEIAGVYGERLRLRVAAPPLEGKANKAVCDFLAARFDMRKSMVQVVSGPAGRTKRILLCQAVADDISRKCTCFLEGYV